jgi:hypothetical protein
VKGATVSIITHCAINLSRSFARTNPIPFKLSLAKNISLYVDWFYKKNQLNIRNVSYRFALDDHWPLRVLDYLCSDMLDTPAPFSAKKIKPKAVIFRVDLGD